MANAKEYAAALQEVSGDSVKTWQSLEDLRSAFVKVPRLKQLVVATGARPAKIRRRTLDALLKGWPAPVCRLVESLAEELAVDRFPEVARAYTAALEAEGFQRTHIESSNSLTSAEVATLLKSLKLNRRTVLLTTAVESDLIGGVRVSVGDTEYDLSVGGALNRLSSELEVPA